MVKEIIRTQHAPAPIGPYNQAVWGGNLLFLSGQIAIDPETGEMVTENIEAEIRQVMKNIEAILQAADLSFKHVVKTSIFLEDMDNFNRINEIYGQYFEEGQEPARETVEVSYLPKGVNIEISVVATR